ncbi:MULTISPECIES: nucleotide-binding protein [unclassified Cryobacterium]|uniref:TIR domain-containing protein n=1 Tax=unclassified Cryobacterium TaxID=2649013 RepID=UPI00141AFEB8|nr:MULTISPECIES: nucleotide-binding protein [unclassified Cryobacterium]
MTKKVFVVHGRNEAARDAMFSFLRSIGLQPIEWDQAIAATGQGSPYIGHVLDVAFEQGQALVVLLTPDDVAYLRDEYSHGEADPETTPAGQARPNVLFEAGMAIGRHPDRTILVELGTLRAFSDVAGRHAVRLSNSPEARKSLIERLRTAGCDVDTSGSSWFKEGDFTPPPLPGGGFPVGKRIPSGERRGPHLDGRWHSSGGNRFDDVRLTNNGAVALFDVEISVPKELQGHVQLHDNGPLKKLPVGKTFTAHAWTTQKTMGPSGPAQFELPVTARLENGAPFQQDVYFDTAG